MKAVYSYKALTNHIFSFRNVQWLRGRERPYFLFMSNCFQCLLFSSKWFDLKYVCEFLVSIYLSFYNDYDVHSVDILIVKRETDCCM